MRTAECHSSGRAIACAALAAIGFALHAGNSHAADGFYESGWASSGREQIALDAGEHRLLGMDVEADGRIFLAGNCGEGLLCAARLLPNGAFDPAFGAQATGTNEYDSFPPAQLASISRRAGGGHYLVGWLGDRAFVACVAENGLIDTTCSHGTGYLVFDFRPDVATPSSGAYASALLPDGRLLVAGTADVHRNGKVNNDVVVARLKADLSGLDTTFGVSGVASVDFDLDGTLSGGSNYDAAFTILVQPDGRIVVAGVAQDAGIDKRIVARLLATGALDSDFPNGGRLVLWGPPGTGGYIEAMTIDRYGGLILAGYYQVLGYATQFDVTRLTPQGLYDWDTSVAFDGASYATGVAMQPDGKVLASGAVLRPVGQYFGVVRLLPDDGSLDSQFGTFGKSFGYYGPPTQVSGYDEKGWVVAAADRGILVAGTSKTASGQHVFGIAKLQLDSIYRGDFEP